MLRVYFQILNLILYKKSHYLKSQLLYSRHLQFTLQHSLNFNHIRYLLFYLFCSAWSNFQDQSLDQSGTITMPFDNYHHHHHPTFERVLGQVGGSFLARATVGTLLYVSLCQSVCQSVSAFLFFGNVVRRCTLLYNVVHYHQ